MDLKKMKLDTKLVGSSALVVGFVLLLLGQFFLLIHAVYRGHEQVVTAEDAMRLAQEVNVDFQLAVSKGKNVAILKDDKNRERTLLFLNKALEAFQKLQKMEQAGDEQEFLTKMGTGLSSVKEKLETLTQKKDLTGSTKIVYEAYLQDITIDFDNASEAYISFLDKKLSSAQADMFSAVEIGKWTGVVLLLAALAGIGLNLFISLGVARTLKGLTRGLLQSADRVASVSAVTASASQQLAEGAGESASSLEEASSSLEEMASMTRQNAENALRASKMMEDTRALVLEGNQAVEETVKSITETSQSAGKISKILKTIEEISFQTNLLALNAAVEAARAGEQGKGFAVVAEEVRNLAHRSAAAVKETAVLIKDNADRVGQGVKVSEAAGRTLTQIVQRARQVSGLVGEIAAACQEQSKGIEEINGAVAQMDKVTQRNTSNAEELSSSSEEMANQAKRMKDMVVQLAVLPGGAENPAVPGSKTLAKGKLPVTTAKTAKSYPTLLKENKRSSETVRDKKPFSSKNSVHSAAKSSPEEVIPLGSDDLRDF